MESEPFCSGGIGKVAREMVVMRDMAQPVRPFMIDSSCCTETGLLMNQVKRRLSEKTNTKVKASKKRESERDSRLFQVSAWVDS
jgi:hypothetical protein